MQINLPPSLITFDNTNWSFHFDHFQYKHTTSYAVQKWLIVHISYLSILFCTPILFFKKRDSVGFVYLWLKKQARSKRVRSYCNREFAASWEALIRSLVWERALWALGPRIAFYSVWETVEPVDLHLVPVAGRERERDYFLFLLLVVLLCTLLVLLALRRFVVYYVVAVAFKFARPFE